MANLGSFTVPILLVGFAILVWKASPDRLLNRRFTTYTLVAAVWATAVTAAHAGTYLAVWVPISFAAGSLLPVSFLSFMCAYAPAASPYVQRVLRTLLFGWVSVGVLFGLASLTTNLVIFDPVYAGGEVSRKPGLLYPFFAVFTMTTWVMAIALFVSKWREARGRTRAELQYFAAGMIVPGIAAIVTNVMLPWITGRSSYGAIGPYFALSFVAIIGHALIRHRVTDLRLVIHKSLTLAIATLASSIPSIVLLYLFGPRLFGHLQIGELALVLVTIGLVIVIVPPIRNAAGSLLDRYVYRTQANYRRTVLAASRTLARMLDLKRLLSVISTTVVGSTGADGVIIYLRDEDGSFKRAIDQRRHDASQFQTPEEAPPLVISALGCSQEPVVADELARQITTETQQSLNDCLVANNWSLLLPVVSDDGLIAVIVVGSKLSGDPFYSEDLDLLMTLANQAGIAIKNARLYAQVVLANEYIENIVATIESGVVAITSAGRVAMFNRSAERFTGLQADQVKGQPASCLAPCLSEPLLASASDGQARTLPEIELPGGDRTRPVMCTTSPLRDPEGVVLGAVAVFSDLTPLKELEIERRRAERLAYFEVLASGLAHEIKNPLVAIKTFTQLLPRRRNEPQFAAEFERIVGREIHRMERLVDRLGALSRQGRRPQHSLDVRTPLTDALEVLQATFDEKGIVVASALGALPCPVVGDHEALEQLFLNLLMNAQEATPPGGTLRIDVTCDADRIRVAIADSGPGIAPEILPKIFEPFFTTKQRGSGLGLAISAGVAQAHAARLKAENGPAGGAVFSVELPLAAVSARVSA
jgi:PAS domain S-box-containing protein